MKQCPKCYASNSEGSQYCANCGTPLSQGEASYPTVMARQQQQIYEPPVQYPVPAPIYTTPTPSFYVPMPSAWREKITYNTVGVRKRSAAGIFLGVILYLLGGLIFAFGLACCFMLSHNVVFAAAAFFIGLALSLLSLVYTLLLHSRPLLRGWIRIILFIILQVPAIATLVLSLSGDQGSNVTDSQYLALGVICVLYGICTGAIALI